MGGRRIFRGVSVLEDVEGLGAGALRWNPESDEEI